jgi:peptide chain release factor 1
VTVAVLAEPGPTQVRLDERDIEWSTFRGSGNGGQKRNKTESAVRAVHKPSGLIVRVENERSQLQNKELAKALLRARLYEAEQNAKFSAMAATRKEQVGSGMRGDKIRTIRYQDDVVIDHRNGRKTSVKRYLRGDWEEILV